jgi:hypothetical protein
MRPPANGALPPAHLDGATSNLLDRLHSFYLTALARRGRIEPDEFATWEAVVAVGRMSEPVPSEDLISLWHRWRAEGSSAAGAMIARCLQLASEAGGSAAPEGLPA